METKYSDRFNFIDDEILRENISLTFKYINFLILISKKKDYSDFSDVSYSIYKDMIVCTGSVIESCLHFCLKKYFELEKIKSTDVMPCEWKNKICKKVYDIALEKSEVCTIIRQKKPVKLTDITQFKDINTACKKAEILNNELYEKAEYIRDQRNKIHLTGMMIIDDFYTENDAKIVFAYAKDLLTNIKNKLSTL